MNMNMTMMPHTEKQKAKKKNLLASARATEQESFAEHIAIHTPH